MKKLFNTPKRAIILVICMVVVIAAIALTAVKSTLITEAEAKSVALKDAGLDEAQTSALRARLEFDDGRFQYDVDFYSNGTEYEYFIQAKDGDIIARDIEGAGGNNYGQDLHQDTENPSLAEGDNSMQTQEHIGNQPATDADNSMQTQEHIGNQPATDADNSVQTQEHIGNQPATDADNSVQMQEDIKKQSAADENRTVQTQGNSLDEAKAAALRDAGLSESDVTFKKTELDLDHGTQVYDIEFYTSDTEYDYKINASDGTVLEKSFEQFQVQANQTYSTANDPSSYIGVDSAKTIALNHANLNKSDVQFAKAKLENDDGKVEYEIEFYFGKTEYDYTIDAVSGNIIEYDVDYD